MYINMTVSAHTPQCLYVCRIFGPGLRIRWHYNMRPIDILRCVYLLCIVTDVDHLVILFAEPPRRHRQARQLCRRWQRLGWSRTQAPARPPVGTRPVVGAGSDTGRMGEAVRRALTRRPHAKGRGRLGIGYRAAGRDNVINRGRRQSRGGGLIAQISRYMEAVWGDGRNTRRPLALLAQATGMPCAILYTLMT